MKTLARAAMAAVALVAMMETANASGKIGGVSVNSCEITSPFKLTESESAELARLGYSVRVKRSEFVRERMVQTYAYFELKDKKKVPGSLFLNLITKPFDKSDNSHVAKRELRLNLATSQYDSLLAVAYSTPPKWARTKAEEKNADVTNFPACVD